MRIGHVFPYSEYGSRHYYRGIEWLNHYYNLTVNIEEETFRWTYQQSMREKTDYSEADMLALLGIDINPDDETHLLIYAHMVFTDHYFSYAANVKNIGKTMGGGVGKYPSENNWCIMHEVFDDQVGEKLKKFL
jgi:hypothetical protein